MCFNDVCLQISIVFRLVTTLLRRTYNSETNTIASLRIPKFTRNFKHMRVLKTNGQSSLRASSCEYSNKKKKKTIKKCYRSAVCIYLLSLPDYFWSICNNNHDNNTLAALIKNIITHLVINTCPCVNIPLACINMYEIP